MPETLVVDCSVAAKWVLPEPGRARALRLFDQWASGEVELIAPGILLAEFASLLAKRCRRKELTATQANEAFVFLVRCAPRLYETRPRLGPAMKLALEHHLSLWDCLYLALAAERDCSVVTADRRLARGGAARHLDIRLLE